ncbi:Protein-glutamate methylesterase/protein-glutamine glutaminase [Streptomyces badius]
MGSVPVTVLVVDDDALVRDGLRRILESADDIRVPAVCGPGEALELARRHRPDVALVDLHMPGTDGIEVLRGLQGGSLPEPRRRRATVVRRRLPRAPQHRYSAPSAVRPSPSRA